MADFFNFIAEVFQETFKIIPIIGDPLNWAFISLGGVVFVVCAKKFI
jgi:hypothetical protein